MEDRELIRGIKSGSEKHFKMLFDTQHAKIYSVSRKTGLSHEASQEIVQEVFISLWKQRQSLREELSIQGLLKTMAKRLLIKKIRRRLIESTYQDYLRHSQLNYANATFQQVMQEEINTMLEKALEELPDRRKEVFLLNYQQGLSAEEIALALDISERTAENQLYRARKFLKTYFIKHGFDIGETLLLYYWVTLFIFFKNL